MWIALVSVQRLFNVQDEYPSLRTHLKFYWNIFHKVPTWRYRDCKSTWHYKGFSKLYIFKTFQKHILKKKITKIKREKKEVIVDKLYRTKIWFSNLFIYLFPKDTSNSCSYDCWPKNLIKYTRILRWHVMLIIFKNM